MSCQEVELADGDCTAVPNVGSLPAGLSDAALAADEVGLGADLAVLTDLADGAVDGAAQDPGLDALLAAWLVAGVGAAVVAAPGSARMLT